MENSVLLIVVAVWTSVFFSGGFLFGAWFATRNRQRVPPPYAPEEEVVKVKRTRTSLRNPMRTYDVRYDDFKTKRGLYEPVKPRGRTREQEDELGV